MPQRQMHAAEAAAQDEDRAPEQMTKEELKKLLKSLGGQVSGNKADLIRRLQQMRAELDDSDDDEQYDDSVQQFMRTDTEGFREEFRNVQDEDSEFDFLNVMWMGQQYRQEAQLPHHLELDPLCIQFKETVQKNYNLRFLPSDTDSLQRINIDSEPVLQNRRTAATQKAYMTVGCLFFIYICFYTENLVNLSSPLFTWANCASFIEKYVKMPKRHTARGTAGLTLPSMGMLNKCAMVLNGMFRRERELFGSYLQTQEFQGKDKFFLEPIEDGRPAVAHNPDWREQYRKHSRKLKRLVQSNSLPNSEVIKAGVRLTDDECYAIALQLLSDGGKKIQDNFAHKEGTNSKVSEQPFFYCV